MQMMNEEKLSKDIEKIINKIQILQKKKKMWDLSEIENEELLKLLLEYMRTNYQLTDVVFLKYIEPFLYNEKIIDLKGKLMSKYNWEGQLLFIDKDIQNLVNKINNKSEILDIISEITNEELELVDDFNISIYGEEISDLFASLQNNDKYSIKTYIQMRREIILEMIMEG